MPPSIFDSEQEQCCAPGCEALNVIARAKVPLCERHLILSYREITQYLETKKTAQAEAAKYGLIGKPFGICPSCDLVLLARHPDRGDIKCIDPSCGYTGTPAEFRKLCDRRAREMAEHTEIVYYLRFSDRVKIGTTKNLEQRLIAVPHDEVMTTEPGGAYVEQLRHKQFDHLRIRTGSHREWFQLAPELSEHIATLKARQAA